MGKIPFLKPFLVTVLVGFITYQFAINAKTPESDQPNMVETKQDIAWRTDLGAAIKEAKSTNKPIFVDFYGDHCAPCIQLEKETYPDANVAKALANYIPVKVRLSETTSKWFDKYFVSVTPSLFVLDSNGKAIKSTQGFLPPREFISLLRTTS